MSFFLAYSDLPAFLVNEGGLNSGFMIAHCTSAALGKSCSYNLNISFYSVVVDNADA